MKRRTLLGIGAMTLSGCLGTGGSGSGSNSVGDSVTHDGVQATVHGVELLGDPELNSNEVLRSGFQALLVDVELAVVGDRARPFPHPVNSTM